MKWIILACILLFAMPVMAFETQISTPNAQSNIVVVGKDAPASATITIMNVNSGFSLDVKADKHGQIVASIPATSFDILKFKITPKTTFYAPPIEILLFTFATQAGALTGSIYAHLMGVSGLAEDDIVFGDTMIRVFAAGAHAGNAFGR